MPAPLAPLLTSATTQAHTRMPEPFTCVLPHSAPPLVRARAHDANHSLGRLSLDVTCQPTTHCSQAPVIITFRMPTDASFSFDAFYERLAAAGYMGYYTISFIRGSSPLPHPSVSVASATYSRTTCTPSLMRHAQLWLRWAS